MTLRWFLSPVLRQATDTCKHVRKMLHAQRDILNDQAIEAVTNSLNLTEAAIKEDQPDLVLLGYIKMLEEVVRKMFKPYPNAHWRENIEVMLVAIVVAMGIRTFFVQPFKIPTGSMEPTLYGNEPENLRNEPASSYPSFFGQLFDAVARGQFYHQYVAPEDGQIMEVKPTQHVLFVNYQQVLIQYRNTKGLTTQTFWFGPDNGKILSVAGMVEGLNFRKGDLLMRIKESSGDHLFVDRITYNFRHPKRGEIVVFKTKGTEIEDQNQFYIKRLIGLPNEKLSIGDDRHLRVDGVRLDSSTPHFENVYGFDPNTPPQGAHYSGHTFSPVYFKTADESFQIRPNHYMVFGDNTMNSADSRYWGEVPAENFIGRSWLVYWPITERFGWGQK